MGTVSRRACAAILTNPDVIFTPQGISILSTVFLCTSGFQFFYLFIKFDKPERVCTIFTCKKGDKAFEKKCDIVWDDFAVNINVQKRARKKTKNISQVSLNP